MNAGTCRSGVLTVAVFAPSGRPSAGARRKGSGVVVVPEKLIERWEAAYRRYGQASRSAASSVAGDRDAAWEMAAASREVAAAWHEMESASDLPWWALAALVAGAQAFEFQARDWTARAEYGWPLDVDGVSRPQVRLATRARPDGRRARSREVSEHGDQHG